MSSDTPTVADFRIRPEKLAVLVAEGHITPIEAAHIEIDAKWSAKWQRLATQNLMLLMLAVAFIVILLALASPTPLPKLP